MTYVLRVSRAMDEYDRWPPTPVIRWLVEMRWNHGAVACRHLDFRHIEPRVIPEILRRRRSKLLHRRTRLIIADKQFRRLIRVGVHVSDVFLIRRKRCLVPSGLGGDLSPGSASDAHRIEMALARVDFAGGEIELRSIV